MLPAQKTVPLTKAPSVNRLDTNTGPPGQLPVPRPPQAAQTNSVAGAGDVVPKVLLDEKLQELLAKDDMIQVRDVDIVCVCEIMLREMN
jgi:hypothetical protein